ncbi:hypothetical protein EJ419_04405 [Alloscardovia theropitheci]|uniref:Protein kinase domain-containing protein n=1 Tax=Alloscardovia theropitheci TaxID=2496842 RepID=A0A4R0QPV5_9BIFI|nr:hypothetical protein [Alloscardovia theropitheci]TCD54284.1 hypothetical protein EJ419_04405 [Alloscardovia theropitheci]
MNFSVGDVLLDRFRLVEVLRDEPSFSVWIAHDSTLGRSCQIFVVANSTIISRVNAAASALALSQDPHFTRVLHLYRDGEVCVIVSDADSGITIRDYLTHSREDHEEYPLTTQAARSIIGEVTEICKNLDDNNQAHYCLDDITVRLTEDRVILANFPISAALLPPTAPRLQATNHDVESVMVYQIAALAFELLTGTAYTSLLATHGRKMLQEANAPADLELICTRGLGLPDSKGRTPVPLVTLLEMSFLLDEYEPLHELAKHPQIHINLTGEPTSAPSIMQAVLRRVDAKAIAPIPRSLRENPDVNSDKESFQQWSASELIFSGNGPIDITKPDTSTDLFHALGELDATKLERVYDPYDFNDYVDSDTRTEGMNTQAIRIAAQNSIASENSSTSPTAEGANTPQDSIATGSFGTSSRVSQDNSHNNVSRETSIYEPQTEVIPPSFAPRANQKRNTSSPQISSQSLLSQEQVSESAHTSHNPFEQLWKRALPLLRTRAAAITGVLVILLVLVIVAVYSLTAGRNSFNGNSDPWSQISQETVRFPGQENNKGSNEPAANDSKQADTKDAQKESASGDDSSQSQESSSQDNKQNASSSKKSAPSFDDNAIRAQKLPREKSVSAVPTPAGTGNSTVITPRGYTYLERPGGVRGWGYSFAFDQPTTIWRMEIGNQTGGGQVHVYSDPTTDDPRSGTEVASFSFASNGQPTNVIFKKPVTATTFVVWIDGTDATTLPQVIRLTHYAFY